jgi:hypothetical protein
MSRLKEIEHDGFEEYVGGKREEVKHGHSTRRKVKKLTEELEKVAKESEEADLIHRQQEYMSVDNPLLWEGDYDD